MRDASGSTKYEYSPKGQVKKEAKTIDSIQYVTQYTYDQNGNLKTMTYPSGRVITYNTSNDKVVSVLNNAAEPRHEYSVQAVWWHVIAHVRKRSRRIDQLR